VRVVACVAAMAALAHDAVAQEQLTADENTRLMHGETITREQTLERGEDHRYVGGVTYTIVEATPEELGALLYDVHAYQQILPRTKSARLVGMDAGDIFIELHQGNAIAEASYTIRVHKDPAKREIRFFLDPTRPHGIADAWGFMRYEPLAQVAPGVPRMLVTYGVLVDLGPGIVRDLFEERLRRMMLSVPQRMRQYVRAIRSRPLHA